MTRAGTLWPTIAAVATNGGLLERRIGGFRLEWTPYVGFLFRCYSDPDLYREQDWPKFLRRAVEERKNILISGATGSGKTSLSKALIKLIPDYERILTIEDTRELVVPQRNCVHMTYSKDGNSRQKIGAKGLLESSLRMRPDRILL